MSGLYLEDFVDQPGQRLNTGRAFLDQTGIDARGFHDPVADVADVRHLRAQVIVQQTEAVQHAPGAQGVHHVHDLGGGQALDLCGGQCANLRGGQFDKIGGLDGRDLASAEGRVPDIRHHSVAIAKLAGPGAKLMAAVDLRQRRHARQ